MYRSAAAKLTVSVPENLVVTKVEFSCPTYYTFDVDGGALTTGTKANNLFPVTWEGEESAVTFSTATNGNVFIKTMTVYTADAPAVRAPQISRGNATLYAGVDNVITATCATEGATIMYKVGEGEYQTFPAEGITVSETATYTFQAVLGEEKSSEKVCSYTLVTPVEVSKASEIYALEDGATVKVTADLAVVAYDSWNKYAFLGTNEAGEVIPVKGAIAEAGNVIKAGWLATFKKTGGSTYDSFLTLLAGSIETTNEAAIISVPAVTVSAALSDAAIEYNRVVLQNVAVTKTAIYNYDLTDKDGNKIHSYEQWGSFPKTIDAEKTYDVEGVLVTTLDGRQIYPIAVAEHSFVTTFDFSNPATYGYTEPEEGYQTNLQNGDQIIAGDITITNVENGTVKSFFGTSTYYTNFKKEDGIVNLRILNKTVVTIAAPEGMNIKKITFTGTSLDKTKTFSAGVYTITENGAEWVGDENTITLTNGGDFYISTMAVEIGEPAKVKAPEFSSTGDVLYEGVTAPKTITLSCATEGATLQYRTAEDGEWITYTDGITITETCTVWAKGVIGEDESVIVSASYTVKAVPTVNTATEFAAVADGDICKTGQDLTVAYHWKTAYYSVILAVDAEGGVIYINDKNTTIAEQIPAGSIIAAGLAGQMHAAGYMSHKPDFQPVSDIIVKEGTTLPEPTGISLAELDGQYGKYLELKAVNIEQFINPSTGKPVANNYVLSDEEAPEVRLYNRYSVDMTNLEDCKYDIKGILINNGSMDQFFPISFTKSTSTAISSTKAVAAEQDGKRLENKQIVIVKAGKKYNTAGQMLK